MVPVAVLAPMVVPADGEDSATAKVSVDSVRLSSATLTVTVWLVCPAAKLTVPEGNTPPTKSIALAGFAPVPVTDQTALEVRAVLPDRVTVKVKGVEEPIPPSA